MTQMKKNCNHMKKKRRGGQRDESVMYLNYNINQLFRLFASLNKKYKKMEQEKRDKYP